MSVTSARILVLSASVGAGHMSAAEAVESALLEKEPNAVVKNMDVLMLSNPAFRRMYGRFYLDLVNKAPQVLGVLYDLLDDRTSDTLTKLRILSEKSNLRPLISLLTAGAWDLVINTHFLPAEIISHLRKKKIYKLYDRIRLFMI